jgi:hypothetical protein
MDGRCKKTRALKTLSQHFSAKHGWSNNSGSFDIPALQQAGSTITGNQIIRIASQGHGE